MKIYSITNPNNNSAPFNLDYSNGNFDLAYILGINYDFSKINPSQLLWDIYHNLITSPSAISFLPTFANQSKLGLEQTTNKLELKLQLNEQEVKHIESICNFSFTINTIEHKETHVFENTGNTGDTESSLYVNPNFPNMYILNYSRFLETQGVKYTKSIIDTLVQPKCIHFKSINSIAKHCITHPEYILHFKEETQKEIFNLFKTFTGIKIKEINKGLFHNLKYEYSQILKICQSLVLLEKDFILLIDEIDSGLLHPQSFFNQLRKEIFKRNGQLIFSSRCEDIHNVCAKDDYFSDYYISLS